jgi:hypothetical protein
MLSLVPQTIAAAAHANGKKWNSQQNGPPLAFVFRRSFNQLEHKQKTKKNPPDRIDITYRHLRLHHLAHHTHTMLPFFFTVSTTAAAAAAAGLSYILYAVI